MPTKNPAIAIVGGETALGRDLREKLQDAQLGGNLQLIGAEDQISGILTERDGELVVMTPLDQERLAAAEIVFCCGSPQSAERAASLLPQPRGPALIDMTYALEDRPSARLRSPLTESSAFGIPENAIQVVAHPAAIALALLLKRIGKAHTIRHSIAQILEPASERGQAGMNELQQQSTGLLSFQTLRKEVYDAQVAFNVLPRYGEDAPQKLEDLEVRIDRHLATLLGDENVPMPSLRLMQAPVFHGYSISLWVEFEARPDIATLSGSLASADVEVRGADLDAPSNAGAAGQSGVTVGVIEPDRNHSRAVWIWAVLDNYRVLVDSAIEVGRQHLARTAG